MAYKTLVDYLMPNSVYTYILNIYDLVWLGFMAYKPFVDYLMPNSVSYIHITYIWYGLVGFYGI